VNSGRRAALACESLERRSMLAASNLFFFPSSIYPSQPLQQMPVIASQNGVLSATVNMVSAGLAGEQGSNAILYGGQQVYSPNPTATSGGPLNDAVLAMAYQVSAYGQDYPAQFPGPLFKVQPGDTLDFRVQNNLYQPGIVDPTAQNADVVFQTNAHGHGLHVSPLSNGDNVLREIGPGEGMPFAFQIPADHPTGMNWYHVHRHEASNTQVYGGLAGMLQVGDPLDPWPQYKDTLTQVSMGLSAVNIQPVTSASDVLELQPYNGGMKYNTAFYQGWQKRINGQVNPTITLRPGETQVWNLASIGAHGSFNLAITDDNLANPWNATLLVQDGNGQFVQPYSLQLAADPARMQDLAAATLLMPGNRLTMAVTAPTTSGTYYLVDGWAGQNNPANNQYIALATIVVSGDLVTETPIFGDVGPVNPLFDQEPDVTRSFEFSITSGAIPSFLINGKVFGDGVMPQMQIGTVEEWTLTNPKLTGPNANNANHPFHIHQGDFIVTEVQNTVTGAWEKVVPTIDPPPAKSSLASISGRDVINIPNGGGVRIRFVVKDFPGKYVFHCHTLKHEDNGMMSPVLAFGPAEGLRLPVGTSQGSPASAVVLNGNGESLGKIRPFGRWYRGGLVTASALGASEFFETMAVGTAAGFSNVRVYTNGSLRPSASFRAFPGRRGGVSLAVGDLDANGEANIVVGSRAAGRSVVRIFDRDGALVRTLTDVLPGRCPTGVNVAVGDVNGDNFDDLIVSAGRGRDPLVVALDGEQLANNPHMAPAQLFSFTPGGGARAGARVAIGFVAPGTVPSYLANVVTTPEAGSQAGVVQVWNPNDLMSGGHGHSAHSHAAPAALETSPSMQQAASMPIAEFQPLGPRVAPIQLTTSYQRLSGTTGQSVITSWRTTRQIALTTLSDTNEATTELRTL
jgi:FtsP/CotA-like multicopper oxidase with cupredoxin domain